MTLDLDKLDAEDCMSIAGRARIGTWQEVRDWLYQIAYQQERQAGTRK